MRKDKYNRMKTASVQSVLRNIVALNMK